MKAIGRKRAATVVLALAALCVPATASAANDCRAGAAGVGDRYFPGYGNGGYDVTGYDLEIAYDPADDTLRGRTKVRARAEQNLCSVNLDLLGFDVRRVKVRGHKAGWSRDGMELTITPKARIEKGSRFSLIVRYSGIPADLRDPFYNLPTAFMPTSDGANVVGQPESAANWFPVNDHPSDKASYSFDVAVPDGYEVVANGRFRGTESDEEGWTRWLWEAEAPMAPYLTTIDIGQWDVNRWRTADGLPVYDAVDPAITGELRQEVDSSLGKQGEILELLSSSYGRAYPFDTVGGIVDPERPIAYALETQTRPVYSSIFWLDGNGEPTNGDYVVVHELAHQWFGDDIALSRWRDIWLNEGFATYAEFLWTEHTGGPAPQQFYEGALAAFPADDPLWSIAIGDPGVDHLFDQAVYLRGAMTLQALRNEVGDEPFWAVIRRWAKSRAGGHGTTGQFIELAEKVSGRQLDDLFDVWLFTPEKPQVATPQSSHRSPARDPTQRSRSGSANSVTATRESPAELARRSGQPAADERGGVLERLAGAVEGAGERLEVVPPALEALDLHVDPGSECAVGEAGGVVEEDLVGADLDQGRGQPPKIGEERGHARVRAAQAGGVSGGARVEIGAAEHRVAPRVGGHAGCCSASGRARARSGRPPPGSGRSSPAARAPPPPPGRRRPSRRSRRSARDDGRARARPGRRRGDRRSPRDGGARGRAGIPASRRRRRCSARSRRRRRRGCARRRRRSRRRGRRGRRRGPRPDRSEARR